MGKISEIHAHMYRNTPHGKPQWARPIYPDMTPENIKAWLDNPPAIKAGSWMPDYGLTPEQIDALTAYLLTLK